jgi:hypothetical protein
LPPALIDHYTHALHTIQVKGGAGILWIFNLVGKTRTLIFSCFYACEMKPVGSRREILSQGWIRFQAMPLD